MTARQSTPSSEHSSHSDSSVRKRVCKACDRCRLKKSKCDGANPCSRCRTDNAICIFGERKKTHDKVYPKGYVEMLEQQQAWLVHGLQELYRRTCDGEGWPGEPLKCEPNGHPLTHDLLMRLGALDQGKGEHFEENTDTMQQDLWRQQNAIRITSMPMQRQDSSNDSSVSPQSPIGSFGGPTTSTSSLARHDLPPTPPTYSPVSQPTVIKTEPQLTPTTSSAIAAQISLQGVVNPIALQGAPPQWPSNAFGSLDEMDLMAGSEYSGLPFDDQQLFTGRQVPMNCMAAAAASSSSSFLDTKPDYDDFNQFLNPNATEITSI